MILNYWEFWIIEYLLYLSFGAALELTQTGDPWTGNWQTVQTQIRRCRTRRLIRVSTVCKKFIVDGYATMNPIIVDSYVSLFNCTTAVRASDSMTASS